MKRQFQSPSDNFEQLSDGRLSAMLRTMPRRVPPARLTASLLEMAARERELARVPQPSVRGSLADLSALNALRAAQWSAKTFIHWRNRLQLDAQHMMRPFALPFAGGVFSAVALFSLFVVPAYPVLAIQGRADVPTNLSTVAKINRTSSATGMSVASDVVVDISVDDQGRMIDYKVVSGGEDLGDARVRKSLENVLLFTEFVPATAFGQPKSGKVRLSLNSSSINVKG